MTPVGLVAAILTLVLGIVGGATPSSPAQRAVPHLQIADRLGDEGGAGQLIVVEAASATDTWAQLQAFDRVRGRGVPRFAPVEARVGRSGVAADRWEGDGTTPAGTFTLTEAFGNGPDPGSGLPYRPVHDQDYWVGDSTSPYYNSWQSGPPDGRFGYAEKLWTMPESYRHAVVIDYNRFPVVAGRGSAIFLHVRNANATSGCVAIDLDRLVAIMRWLDPAKHPKIAIGTDAQLVSG